MCLIPIFLIASLSLFTSVTVFAFPVHPLQRRGVQIDGPGTYYLTNSWATTYTQTLSTTAPGSSVAKRSLQESQPLSRLRLGSGGQVPIHTTWTLTAAAGGAESGNAIKVSTPAPAHAGKQTLQWDPTANSNQIIGTLDLGFYSGNGSAQRDSNLPYGMEIMYSTDPSGQLAAIGGICYVQSNGGSDANACDGAAMYTEGTFAWLFVVQTTDGGPQFGEASDGGRSNGSSSDEVVFSGNTERRKERGLGV